LLLTMLDAVLGLAGQWRRRGVDLPVSLNIDAAQLCEPTSPRASSAWRPTNPDAWRACISNCWSRAPSNATRRPNATIRAFGQSRCAFDLDDFGAGFATPLHLKRLAISTVKLDREFVQGTATSNADRTVVSALISIARAFGCSVVAEGVETHQILDELAALGLRRGAGLRDRPPDARRPGAWVDPAVGSTVAD